MKSVRDYYPTPHLRKRLRALEACLSEVWREYNEGEYSPYSMEGRVLSGKVHSLHTAISETVIAINNRKHRRG